MFSNKSLRRLGIHNLHFHDSEAIDAFCRGVETSSVEHLTIRHVSLTLNSTAEHEMQVATTLARCNTLVNLDFQSGASPLFFDCYSRELSNNFDTKLERLRLFDTGRERELDLRGGQDSAVRSAPVDAAIAAKIRNLLTWNVQRKTCPPLFAAIGNAETDAKRKQCLVAAFKTVDIPVLFEYMTANQGNLIELIQRLGRSHKRHYED